LGMQAASPCRQQHLRGGVGVGENAYVLARYPWRSQQARHRRDSSHGCALIPVAVWRTSGAYASGADAAVVTASSSSNAPLTVAGAGYGTTAPVDTDDAAQIARE